ncbi:MAG: hypothetical protein AAFV74_05160 [Pseudomonadota bacterium]
MKTPRLEFKELSKGKTPPPFSLRFTFEERAQLDEAANGVPLGAYIRAVLFGEDLKKVRRRGVRPVEDQQELARVLAMLGASRLSQNVNQLAKACNIGALPVTPDTEAALVQACDDVADMRQVLLKALGSKPSASGESNQSIPPNQKGLDR